MNWRGNISLSIVAQVLNTIMSFIIVILVARLLGAEGRGAYVLLTTTAMFLVQGFSVGLESSISYYASSLKAGIKKLISTVLLLFFIISTLVVIAVIIFSVFPSLQVVPYPEPSYYVLLVLMSVINIANTFFSSLFNGLKHFKTVILLNLCIQALTLVAALIFFLQGHEQLSVKSFVQVIIGINALVLVTYIYFYKSTINIRPATTVMTSPELKLFFTYSFTAFVCSLLQFLNHRMDFWIINHYYGSGGLGVYSLSASLSQLIWILPQSIALILFPMSGQLPHKELVAKTNKLCRVAFISTLMLLPFACICALFIPDLFGKDFSESVPLFFIFLAGSLPYIFVMISASVFAGTGKLKYNFWASLAGFIVAIIFYFLLIPVYGLTGGAIASSLSYCATAFLGMYFYTRRYETTLKDMLFFQPHEVKSILLSLRNGRIPTLQ